VVRPYQEYKLAHPLFELISRNLLVRAGIGTVAIVVFLGVASGALPGRCWMSADACAPAATKAVANAPAKVATIADPLKKPEPAATPAVAVVAEKATPTLTSNEVISGSFDQLKVELKSPTPPMKLAAPTETRVASTTPKGHVSTSSETGLSTRTVRVISVNPDGTPDPGALLAQGYVSPRVAPLVPQSPATEAVDAALAEGSNWASTEASDPPAEVAETSPPQPIPAPVTKAAPSASDLATIAGSGANIRSAPSKGRNKVLFTLAGGEKVTVGEKKNGWLHITDDQGRRGWVYSDYVKR
jgi:hypothetical protein